MRSIVGAVAVLTVVATSMAWGSIARGSIAGGSIAGGGTCLEYDAALRTQPTDQGWEVTIGEISSVTFGIQRGGPYQSTLPFANPTCPGPPDEEQFIYWWNDAGFLFQDGAVFEAEVKILQSEYGINPCIGWARPGFALSLQDSLGRNFWVGIGESKVFLANNPYLSFGDPGIIEAPFATTDGYHIYRLEVLGSNATLLIDGNPILSLNSFGQIVSPGAFTYIGDGTSWCNSEVLIRRFSLDAGGCCEGDLNGDDMVDGADLGLLLGNWDAAGLGDLDGSGLVDGADLGLLLGAWGDCP